MKGLAEFEMPLKMPTIKGWKDDGSTGKHTCCQADNPSLIPETNMEGKNELIVTICPLTSTCAS